MRAGVLRIVLCNKVVRASQFHLFHLFIDWSEPVGSLVLVYLLGLFVWCFSFASLCC